MQVDCTLSYELNGQTRHLALDSSPCVLGRDPQSLHPIDDDSVSRRHASLERRGSAWVIRDLGSRNGTHVNRARVTEVELHHGDVITLGRLELRVALSGHGASSPGVAQQPLSGIDLVDSQSSVIDRAIDVTDFQQRTLQGGRSPAEAQSSTLGGAESPVAWVLPLIARATEALLGSDDLPDMLRTLLRVAFENLPADRGCILLFGDTPSEHRLAVMHTRSGSTTEAFAISSTIARQASEKREAVLFRDAIHTDLAHQHSIVANMIRSAMCVPLVHERHVAGLLYLDSQSPHRRFNGQHLEALTTLALLSAAGIQKAQLRESIRQEQAIRRQLERYSAPAVVDRIVQGDPGGRMQSEELDASVLFLDLVGFTTWSEQLPPAAVVQMLNGLFEHLTDCVFTEEGTLDKFTGDGLMAIFGAPLPQPDHAHRAVRAALAMHACLERYNREFPERTLAMRIGINSGPVVAGDIGSQRRRDYTVIGDTVNVASRLEAHVARPGQVVIGPRTHEQVCTEFNCTSLGVFSLKGKTRQLEAFAVASPGNLVPSPP